jgi:hypothetical protein
MNNPAEEIESLRAALRDIVTGADVMLQPINSAAVKRYAAEVKRVAKAALAQAEAEAAFESMVGKDGSENGRRLFVDSYLKA